MAMPFTINDLWELSTGSEGVVKRFFIPALTDPSSSDSDESLDEHFLVKSIVSIMIGWLALTNMISS